MFLFKISSMQDVYSFDPDWQSYLKDKEIRYWNSIEYQESQAGVTQRLWLCAPRPEHLCLRRS